MKKPVCVVIIWEERVISPWGIDPRGDTIEIHLKFLSFKPFIENTISHPVVFTKLGIGRSS